MNRIGWMMACLCLAVLSASEPPCILLLHSYHHGMTWTDDIDAAARAALARALPGASIQTQYMDAKRYPRLLESPELAAWWGYKYNGVKFDGILCSDDFAYQFLRRHRDTIFADSPPVVFCGVNDLNEGEQAGFVRCTGVVESYDIGGTVDLIRRLQPTARRLVVVGDRTLTGQANRRRVEKALAEGRLGLPIDYLDDLTLAELLADLRGRDRDQPILLLAFNRGRDGKTYTFEAVTPSIVEAAQAPSYTVWDFQLPFGVVGGMVTSGASQGEAATSLLVRALAGEPAGAIPVVRTGVNRLTCNAKVLEHWRLDARLLPEGTILLDTEPSLLHEYAGSIATALGLIVALGGLSAGLALAMLRRRRAERDLAGREHALNSLLENATDLITMLAPDGIYLSVNSTARGMLGQEPGELIGRSMYDFVHAEDVGQVKEALGEALAEPGRSISILYRRLHRDGGWLSLEANLRAFQPTAGAGMHVINNARDVTRRLAEQAELRRMTDTLEIRVAERTREIGERNDQLLQEIIARTEADARLLTLTAAVDQSTLLVLILGLDRRVSYANTRLRSVTAFADEAILGKDVFTWAVNPPTLEELHTLWSLVDAGEEWHGEMLIWKADGGSFWALLTISSLRNSSGTVTGFLVSMLDITARKLAEEEKARLGWVIEQVAEVIVITSAKGIIQYVNPAFERLTGWNRNEAIGKTPAVLKSGVHPKEFYRDMWSTISDGRVWSGRLVNRRRDGSLFHEEGTISPVRDAQGRIVKFIAVKRDIGELLRLEAQLKQAQKLESIGQLAAGIAHEINTPIQFIGDNTRFVADSFDFLIALTGRQCAVLASHPDEAVRSRAAADAMAADLPYLISEVPKAIGHTLEGVVRVATIVKAMKEFAHPGGAELVPTDLNHLIGNATTISRSTWRYCAELTTDLDATLPAVPLSAGDFNQVLLNLIVNAAHAIEDARRGRQGSIRITTGQADGHAILSVSDDGCGIPPEHLSRIYDPFFTTKAVGRGSGQGLGIARSVIVEKHRGSIDCVSVPGESTVFTIRLPLALTEKAHA